MQSCLLILQSIQLRGECHCYFVWQSEALFDAWFFVFWALLVLFELLRALLALFALLVLLAFEEFEVLDDKLLAFDVLFFAIFVAS